jgi:hypothetical protein
MVRSRSLRFTQGSLILSIRAIPTEKEHLERTPSLIGTCLAVLHSTRHLDPVTDVESERQKRSTHAPFVALPSVVSADPYPFPSPDAGTSLHPRWQDQGWGRGSGFARRGWESARWPLFEAWGPHAMPRDPSRGKHAHAARAPCLVLSRGTAAPTTVTRASESRTAGSRLRTPARAGDAERPFFSNRPLHAGARSCVCCQPSSRDDAAGDYIGRGCLVTPTSAT